MSQYDPFLLEEYKNPFIEFAKFAIFQTNSSLPGAAAGVLQLQSITSENSYDSIYIQLLLYWNCLLNDVKNLNAIHLTYLHSLNTIKTLYFSSSKFWFFNFYNHIMNLQCLVFYQINSEISLNEN